MDNENWGNSRSKLAASPIANEEMAAYRDRVRDQYKVVWTVRLGPNIALATNADNFMPNHFGVGQLPDSYAYNLRYCEEMVCLDVGHMTLTDISFVEYMPNLKYLILAWTEVQYIEPIRSCKNLVFLELDHSCIRDISPAETFGMVYLEAMSQGVPVLYTRGQGFDGQFEEGEVGFSVVCGNVKQQAQMLGEITADYALRSARCIDRAKDYAWPIIAKKWMELYLN